MKIDEIKTVLLLVREDFLIYSTVKLSLFYILSRIEVAYNAVLLPPTFA